MAAHSLWPASSAKRNIECAAAYGLSLKYANERKSSAYAAEGTAAHSMAEDWLVNGVPPEEHVGGTWSADGHNGSVTEEMVDFIREYTDTIDTMRALGFEFVFEQRVSPGWLWETSNLNTPVDLFGTADAIGYNPLTRRLVIVDLKFGRGIAVEIKDNAQLLYYGLGALRLAVSKGWTPIEEIEIVIVQPRAPHPDGPVRRTVYKAEDVIRWGEDVLVPAVEKSLACASVDPKPLDLFKTGDWCRFCPALLDCAKVQEARAAAAANAFDDDLDGGVDPARLAAMLEEAEILERVAARIMDTAYAEATKGLQIPGWKLVPKRAVRAWNDAAGAEELLEDAQIPAAIYLEPAQFKSPYQVLSNRAVKAVPGLAAQLDKFVTATSSGTTLVRDADPRKPVPGRPAAADVFDD